MTTSHVSAPVVYVMQPDGMVRILQRCAVCGEKLRDNIDELESYQEITARGAPAFPWWPAGLFIRVEGERQTSFSPERTITGDVAAFPHDFCLALVE